MGDVLLKMWGRQRFFARLFIPSRTGWHWRISFTVIFTALAMTVPSLSVILGSTPPRSAFPNTVEYVRHPVGLRTYVRGEHPLRTRVSVYQSDFIPLGETIIESPSILPRWSSIRQSADVALRHNPNISVIEEAFGWPFRLASYSFIPSQDHLIPSTPIRTPWWSDGWPLNPYPGPRFGTGAPGIFDRFIPLRPIWPGVLGNAAFFSAGFLLLLRIPMGFAFVVRRFRKRKGHCPRCDYRLIDDAPPGCPECGWGREASPLR